MGAGTRDRALGHHSHAANLCPGDGASRQRLGWFISPSRLIVRPMVKATLLGCAALLLAACGLPYKYEVFRLRPGDHDVVWVYREGALYRCTTYTEQPFCIRAVYAENAPPETAPTSPSPAGDR